MSTGNLGVGGGEAPFTVKKSPLFGENAFIRNILSGEYLGGTFETSRELCLPQISTQGLRLGWPVTERRVAQEPNRNRIETGTVGIVFPGTERGTGTAETVFQEPKPEPEPSSLLKP